MESEQAKDADKKPDPKAIERVVEVAEAPKKEEANKAGKKNG